MTEAEWLACTYPEPMLTGLRGCASDRKLRLFAVACCRRIWGAFSDERSRHAVTVAEAFADGKATEQQLRAVYDAAPNDIGYGAAYCAYAEPFTAAWDGPDHIRRVVHIDDDKDDEWRNQAALLHCIFGPLPFRSVTGEPSWIAPAVKRLAVAIYEERAFDRFPILADALEEAGCTNADILNHCRGPGPHVRGCWVVDILIGRE